MSTVNLIDWVIPGIASRLSRELYINNSFPWAPVDIQLIAYGTGAAVLKLGWKDGDKVLRIYRKSVGKSHSGLLEIAGHYKKNYERMLTWYGDSPGLVPPMEFMVLRGSPLIGPVAASLQPYIHGEKKDLFEDFSDDELLQLFVEDHGLREQFLYFAKQTIHQWEDRTMCFDFLGRQNVMLVTQEGHYNLCLPDYGFVSFEKLTSKGPEMIARFEQRMKRIVSLYELTRESVPVYYKLRQYYSV